MQVSGNDGSRQELERVIKQRDTALQYGLAAEAELQEVEQKLQSTFEFAQACFRLLPFSKKSPPFLFCDLVELRLSRGCGSHLLAVFNLMCTKILNTKLPTSCQKLHTALQLVSYF
jgi:hypothetical protein